MRILKNDNLTNPPWVPKKGFCEKIQTYTFSKLVIGLLKKNFGGPNFFPVWARKIIKNRGESWNANFKCQWGILEWLLNLEQGKIDYIIEYYQIWLDILFIFR